MKTTSDVDADRLTLALNELRLPAIKALWPRFAERADKEGWCAARLLSALVEHELAERDRSPMSLGPLARPWLTASNAISRKRACCRERRCRPSTSRPCPRCPGPMSAPSPPATAGSGPEATSCSSARVRHCRSDQWRANGSPWARAISPPPSASLWSRRATACSSHAPPISSRNCSRPGATWPSRPPSRSSTSSICSPSVSNAWRRDGSLLDDIAYVTKDQAETSVLFELISTRYERRSLLITANQPFGAWDAIFPDPAMTLAAVDRLVHHATIFEMNAESYRRRSAEKARGPGRPQIKASPADLSPD